MMARLPRASGRSKQIAMGEEAIEAKLERGQAISVQAIDLGFDDTHPVIRALAEDERTAYLLLRGGMSQRAVGDQMGLSKFKIHRLIAHVRAKIKYIGRLHDLLLAHPGLFRCFVGCASGCRCPGDCPGKKK